MVIEEVTEEIVEHVRERGREIRALARTEAASSPAHAAVEGRMTEPVIGRLLFGILEDIVGFVDFLEFRLGGRIVLVSVRVKLHRLLSEGLLQIRVGGTLGHAERFVVVAFRHSISLAFVLTGQERKKAAQPGGLPSTFTVAVHIVAEQGRFHRNFRHRHVAVYRACPVGYSDKNRSRGACA